MFFKLTSNKVKFETVIDSCMKYRHTILPRRWAFVSKMFNEALNGILTPYFMVGYLVYTIWSKNKPGCHPGPVTGVQPLTFISNSWLPPCSKYV